MSGQPAIPGSVARAADVQHLQEETLRGLGVYLRGYAPEGSYGRGGVQYLNEDLQNRLMYAGFQAPELKAYILGKRAMTMRTLFRLAGAARGTDRGGERHTLITLVTEDQAFA